jgi:hypothetical protein
VPTPVSIQETPVELDDVIRQVAEDIRQSFDRQSFEFGPGWGPDYNRAMAHITDRILDGQLTNMQLSQNQAILFWNTLGGPILLDEANRDQRLVENNFNACTVMMMLLSRMSLPADREAFFDQIRINDFVARNHEALRAGLGRVYNRLWVNEGRQRRVSFSFPGYWTERFPQLANTADLRRNAVNLRIFEYTMAHDAYHRALDLWVDRARPRETSFAFLSISNPSTLRGGITSVSYDGEAAGGIGLTRDWFSLIAGAVSFRQTNETGIPLLSPRGETSFDEIVGNIGVGLDQYVSLGRLLALSIINGYPLGFNLPSVFFKKLLGQVIVLDDLRDLLSEQEIGGIEYVMHPDRTADELDMVMAPLMQSGSTDEVSLENRDAQFASMIDNVVTNSSPDKFQAITDGFLAVIPRDLLTGLTPEDLRAFIRGDPEIDIADFRRHCNVGGGYAMDSPQIEWLFTVLEEYDQPMRSRFLRFVTGRNILPTGGFGALGRQIRFDLRNRTSWRGQVLLPTTHTCFQSMDLPEYESLDELRRMLTMAINFDAEGGMQG